MNSTIDRSHYSRNYNRMMIDPTASQTNLNQTQMTTIPQTPENPYSYDSMPSNYRYGCHIFATNETFSYLTIKCSFPI